MSPREIMYLEAGVTKGKYSQIADVCMLAKSLQSCPTLWDPMDYSPLGNSVHGILQARTLEWVAMQSSRGFSWPRDQAPISCDSCIAGGFFITEPPEKLWADTRSCKYLLCCSPSACATLVDEDLVLNLDFWICLGANAWFYPFLLSCFGTKLWSASLII